MTNRREKLIVEILKHCDKINANRLTVISVIAFHTDRSLTGFHKEFLNKS